MAVREGKVDKVFERNNQLQQTPELQKLLQTDKMIKLKLPVQPNFRSIQNDTIYRKLNERNP